MCAAGAWYVGRMALGCMAVGGGRMAAWLVKRCFGSSQHVGKRLLGNSAVLPNLRKRSKRISLGSGAGSSSGRRCASRGSKCRCRSQTAEIATAPSRNELEIHAEPPISRMETLSKSLSLASPQTSGVNQISISTSNVVISR